MLIDIVAEQHQHRSVLERGGLVEIARGRRLHRDDRLDLVRALLRDLEAKRAALAVQQQHARADLVHQRHIGGDDGVVGRQPARHRLFHIVVVGLDRELAAGQHPALGRIRIPRAFAIADAKALERIGIGQEGGLRRPYVGRGEACAAAFDRIRDIDVPALAHEHVEPAFAPVRRALVGDAGQAAAVPHQQRQLALALLRQEILHVHLLDHVLTVRVELGQRTTGLAHDHAHRLATDLGHPAADMERAHAAQHDVFLGGQRGHRRATQNHPEQDAAHVCPPWSHWRGYLLRMIVPHPAAACQRA